MQFSSILWNSGKKLWNFHRKMREWSKNLQNSPKIWKILTNCSKSVQRSAKISDWLADLCRFWKMLQNATTLAIVAVHSADNEPPSVSKMWTFGHSPLPCRAERSLCFRKNECMFFMNKKSSRADQSPSRGSPTCPYRRWSCRPALLQLLDTVSGLPRPSLFREEVSNLIHARESETFQ